MTIKRTICKLLFFAVSACLLCSQKTPAQRMYNKERDEQAQAAEKLAETIKNNALFEKQMKNLAVLARKDFDAEFTAAKFQMNSEVLTILTWGQALDKVCRIERVGSAQLLLPGEEQVKASLTKLDQAINDAKAALEKFRAALKQNEIAVNPELDGLFARLGDFSDLLDLAQRIKALDSERANQAISQITSTLAEVQRVYNAYTTRVDAFNQDQQELASIRFALKKVAVQHLQVDESFWKEVAAIRARREAEMTLVRSLINQYALYAFQFGLTDFNPQAFVCQPNEEDCAQKARTQFCEAVTKAKKEDSLTYPKYTQTLTESAKELGVHLQNLEKDNQEVLREAKAALSKLADQTATPDLPATLSPVIERLTTAVQRLDRLTPHDIAHRGELTARQGFAAAAVKLRQSATSPAAEAALRSVIATMNKHQVAHREMAVYFGSAIYDLAALLARRDTPAKLAQLRFTQAARAHSIRKSAVNARAYELIVSGGVKRLALYHKGGIKPETLAAFVHALSTLGIPPAILAR